MSFWKLYIFSHKFSEDVREWNDGAFEDSEEYLKWRREVEEVLLEGSIFTFSSRMRRLCFCSQLNLIVFWAHKVQLLLNKVGEIVRFKSLLKLASFPLTRFSEMVLKWWRCMSHYWNIGSMGNEVKYFLCEVSSICASFRMTWFCFLLTIRVNWWLKHRF